MGNLRVSSDNHGASDFGLDTVDGDRKCGDIFIGITDIVSGASSHTV